MLARKVWTSVVSVLLGKKGKGSGREAQTNGEYKSSSQKDTGKNNLKS